MNRRVSQQSPQGRTAARDAVHRIAAAVAPAIHLPAGPHHVVVVVVHECRIGIDASVAIFTAFEERVRGVVVVTLAAVASVITCSRALGEHGSLLPDKQTKNASLFLAHTRPSTRSSEPAPDDCIVYSYREKSRPLLGWQLRRPGRLRGLLGSQASVAAAR